MVVTTRETELLNGEGGDVGLRSTWSRMPTKDREPLLHPPLPSHCFCDYSEAPVRSLRKARTCRPAVKSA